MYDVIIVGAGPCGLACAIELKESGKKIAIIDKGRDYKKRFCYIDQGEQCKNCTPCNVISGMGGCLHYGDSAKLSYYPSGRCLYDKLGKKEYNRILEKACEHWKIDENKSFYHPEMQGNKYVQVKNYPVCVLESKKLKEYIKNVEKQLSESQNVDLLLENEVENVIKKSTHFEVKIKNENRIIVSPKVVIATGRSGLLWLKDKINEWRIDCLKPESSFGVRFEFPKNYLAEMGRKHPDLKMRLEKDGRKYKTFCFCAGEHGGRIKFMNYGKFTLLDGHILTGVDEDMDKANFAILLKLNKPDSYRGSYWEYINEYIEEYRSLNEISPGKPICQNFYDFKNKIHNSNEKYRGNSSVGELVTGDVFKLFAEEEFIEFCGVIENIFDYVLNRERYSKEEFNYILSNILVIGLEIEGLWDNIMTNSNFESSCEGMFFGGDCGGNTQGILQATISGIKIAEALIES